MVAWQWWGRPPGELSNAGLAWPRRTMTRRDEPEMRNCFQCEVSLNMSQAKKGILLVNDYSHEEFGTAELGRDAGIRPGQPEVNLVPRRSSSHLWFYRGSAEGPAVPALEPRSTRRGAS